MKATDPSDGQETPGYVYEELIRLTYNEDARLATGLANVLTAKLSSSRSPEARLKTLKTLAHVGPRASKAFRRSLRTHDEFLKAAAESGVGHVAGSPAGAVKWQQVRHVAAEVRQHLFQQALIDRDEGPEPDLPPSPKLSGMGNSVKSSGGSKYEGFGSAPVPENFGDRLVDAWESFLTVTDEKKEVLDMCLAPGPTGDYRPVDLPSLKGESMTSSSMSSLTRSTFRKHVPGRAGGGWESSDEDLEDKTVATAAAPSSRLRVDEVATEADERDRSDYGIVRRIVGEFCNQEDPVVSLDTWESCFKKLTACRPDHVVHCVKENFKVSLDIKGSVSDRQIFRLLLLVERIIRSDVSPIVDCHEAFSDILQVIQTSNKVPRNVIKAQKLSLSLNCLVKS